MRQLAVVSFGCEHSVLWQLVCEKGNNVFCEDDGVGMVSRYEIRFRCAECFGKDS